MSLTRSRVQDRVCIVTGAAGGIGAATARALAREGAHICLLDRVSTQAAANEVREIGRRTLEIEGDAGDRAAVRRAIGETEALFGRVDILVNVAGITSVGPAEFLTEEEWDRVLDVNLKATFFFCQSVISIMRRQRYGRIVNVGSLVAKNGGNARPWLDREEQRSAGSVAYGVSKAGVHALTHYLAKELASDGITVNAVAPGPIATSMTEQFPQTLRPLIPVGRMGTVEEVADAILFLASDASAFISGEVLDLNGAMWTD